MGEKQSWTPPELARYWGVAPEKVLGWIERGELAALNLVSRLGGRPRYRITAEGKADFERRRAVGKPPKTVREKRSDYKRYV